MIARLSVLDLAPVDEGLSDAVALRDVVSLARVAEEAGYHRYWVTEHHNLATVAAAAPEVLIGQIAANTSRLRVGSGGVMLPNHSPLKVAEQFKALHTFYPGRIDLGIGRAPGTDGRTALALRRSDRPFAADDLAALLRELRGYDVGDTATTHPFGDIVAMPSDTPLPPLWLLGSSPSSARLAASEGAGYVFAHHFNGPGARGALADYRRLHLELHGSPAPDAVLAVSVIGAPTPDELANQCSRIALRYLISMGQLPADAFADEVARNPDGWRLPTPLLAAARPYLATSLVGTYDDLAARLQQVAEAHEVEELMITSTQTTSRVRENLYRSLGELVARRRRSVPSSITPRQIEIPPSTGSTAPVM